MNTLTFSDQKSQQHDVGDVEKKKTQITTDCLSMRSQENAAPTDTKDATATAPDNTLYSQPVNICRIFNNLLLCLFMSPMKYQTKCIDIISVNRRLLTVYFHGFGVWCPTESTSACSLTAADCRHTGFLTGTVPDITLIS